ncbi:hypothetical protein F2Q68_00040350 [Brassica cretica]|uniref:PH domain-containing protein n=1 Tax=Brassica cretica TaxID=69181 RepID=A0A8S9MUF1_BRACR|nr:hypothetical protein F2Q68_00040350 [Brassica cretica]
MLLPCVFHRAVEEEGLKGVFVLQSAVQQRGGEVNLTLGGIDLNNSGSVVVKADKKLLTVLFPDGRDGRAFTLKADTMEDLQEWKTALENALTQAPSASHVMGQNGIFRNDNAPDAPPVDVDEPKDETPTNLTVFGRPVLLALEEVDGSPSFLEKALRFVEDHVAACMAPLLLRPLLHGDCEIENDFDVGGDGSVQLLQAAAAANHAQAIVITLLEEYDSIFGEGSLSAGLYSDSEESGSGSEEGTDDEEYDDDDGTQGSDDYTDEEEDLEDESEGSYSESEASVDHHGDDIDDDHKARSHTKINDNLSSESKSTKGSMKPQVTKKLLSGSNRSSLPRHDDARKDDNILAKGSDHTDVKAGEVSKTEDRNSSMKEPSTLSSASGESKRHWGRAHGKRNLSMESIDFSAEVDEADADVERLETTKSELQNKITEEVKNNAVLHSSLERRKKALYERREALEKDVERLQEQLQQERDKKAALESGLNMSKGNKPIPETTDVKQQDSRGKSSQKLAGTSKRSGAKGEGNTTTSALSKLTMRLNFLKERRSQIANELSNMDKGKSSSGQPSPSSGQKKSPQESERGTGSNQNQDSDSSKLTSPHVLDRGRSDNGGDRSRGSGGGNHPSTTPRTFSR